MRLALTVYEFETFFVSHALSIATSPAAADVVLRPQAVFLWWVLENKAKFEEKALAEKYPEYGAYAAETPRLLPNFANLKRIIQAEALGMGGASGASSSGNGNGHGGRAAAMQERGEEAAVPGGNEDTGVNGG